MTRLRPHLPATTALALLAIFLAFPALAHPSAAVLGHPQSDTYEHLQGYAWVARRLASGHFPWSAEDFGLPDGGVLWFPDLLGALLVLPLTWTVGAAAAYNVGIAGQLWLSMLSTYALGFLLTERRASGVLAAVIFGASPFVLGLLHSGVTEYLQLGGFPALWLTSRRLLGRAGGPTWPAVLAWGWLGQANAYYALFGAFIPPMVWLAEREVPLATALRRTLGLALGAALICLPTLLAIRASVAAPDAMLREESAPGWDWVFLPANDLAGFFIGGDQLFPDFRDNGNFGIRHVTYLGWTAILLALPSWRRWWRPALLAAILALGPSLHWRGQPVKLGGHFVPLPAALLYLPGSPFRAVHHPYRLTVLPILVLAAAAAETVRRRPRLALAATVVVLGETLWISPGPWPVPTASLAGTVELPAPGGIWDLPTDFRAENRRWMGLQAMHGRPIPYTINVFLPAAWRGNALYQATLSCYAHPDHHTIARDARPPLGVWLLHDSPQTLAEGISQVRGWGIRYVLLHGDAMKPQELRCLKALFTEAGATPAAEDAVVHAFDLGGVGAQLPR